VKPREVPSDHGRRDAGRYVAQEETQRKQRDRVLYCC